MIKIVRTYKSPSCFINISIFYTQLPMLPIAMKTFQLTLMTFAVTWTGLTRICNGVHSSKAHSDASNKHQRRIHPPAASIIGYIFNNTRKNLEIDYQQSNRNSNLKSNTYFVQTEMT